MYLPKAFQEPDLDSVQSFIEENAFATLILPGADGALEIAHLPFLFDRGVGPHGRLRAHVARANPIWKLAAEGRAATVIFNGPHGYVSPRWYERPREQVPTWNYMVVHAHGRAEVTQDRAVLAALLDELSAVYERGAPEPWRFAELDAGLREDLLGAIVGVTISIERVEAKFKMSQNRLPEDRARVERAFRERGGADDLAMAEWMSRAGRR